MGVNFLLGRRNIDIIIIKPFFLFSLAVHPNKLLIATGQATGHDRREGRVSNSYFLKIIITGFKSMLFL